MRYTLNKKCYKANSIVFNGFSRSKRSHEHRASEAKRIRAKVLKIILFLFVIYALYFFIYSPYFKINNILFEGTAVADNVKADINKNFMSISFFMLPKNNYFFFRPKAMAADLNSKGLPYLFSVKKKFPHNLIISAEKNQLTLIWSTQELFYSFDLNALAFKPLLNYMPSSSTLPLIYDLSNTPIDEKNPPDRKLTDLALEIYKTFANYEWPGLEIDYLKTDLPQSDYLKIVMKQGFEIHVNYELNLESQFQKLQKSLLADKIDLKMVKYINLRVENQVIYK